ncbi:MAG TPA: hypothetical protein VFX30_07595 [bacterium]|nr:hypothetical protein [bacterium]
MNLPIIPLRIGVPTCAIGFTVISEPTVAGNALLMFQASQALPDKATLTDAYRLALSQASGLKRLPALTAQHRKLFQEAHEWISCGVEKMPADLTKVYDDFQRDPSLAGISLYFALLADCIRKAL